MSEQYQLQEMRPEGPKDIGALTSGELVLGREPDDPNGIGLGNVAISRNHGKFFSAGGYWFYRDLGSTNGSWVNGDPVPESDLRVIRGGDLVQLADTAIKVVGESRNAQSLVFLFESGRFVKGYPVPEAGRVVEIGGAASIHSIDGEIDENPSLVIERRGESLLLIVHSQSLMCSVSGKPVRGTTSLVDRDRVTAGPYIMVVNLPQSHSIFDESNQAPSSGAKVWLRGWEGESRRDSGATAASGEAKIVGTGTFGGRPLEEEEPEALSTIALDTADVQRKLARFEAHPSRRQAQDDGGFNGPSLSLEDKLVIVVGALMVVALMVVLMWWYLS